MISDREFTRRLLQTVATVVAAIALVAGLYQAREALMLVYVSALIAMGFSPLVNIIQQRRGSHFRRRIPRTLAILVIYLAVVAIVVILGLMIVPGLIVQAQGLWDRVPNMFDQFQLFLIRHGLMRRSGHAPGGSSERSGR